MEILGADGQPAKKALPERCCGRCEAALLTPDIMKRGLAMEIRECRIGPPTVTHFLMAPDKPGAPPGIISHQSWPAVQMEDPGCMQFHPKPDLLS